MKTAALIFLLSALPAQAEIRSAYVAGGCFWCVEADFESVNGVQEVISGYSGGMVQNPTYKQVAGGTTGHFEAVEIRYDPAQISYAEIMRLFLRSIDPLDDSGQFCDRGSPYRTAIFVSDAEERKQAEAAIGEAEQNLGQDVVTPVLPMDKFWPAEEYHQDYYKGENLILTRGGPKRQADAYEYYRKGCGRDQRVKAVWGADAPFAKSH